MSISDSPTLTRALRRQAGRHPDERAVSTPISAYLLRWGHVSRDEHGRLVRAVPGCLDAWVAKGATLPNLVDHEDRAGAWERYDLDEVGLLAHGHLDDSAAGRRAVEDIRAGRVHACSFRGSILEHAPSGETRDGEPVLDMVLVDMVEGGPTDRPADPGSAIVSFDGRPVGIGWRYGEEPRSMDDALAFLASVSGLSITVEDIQRRDRRVREAATDQADTAERYAIALRKARRAADLAYWHYRQSYGRQSDYEEYRAQEDYAKALDQDLRDLICHDPAIYQQLVTRFKIPPPRTIAGRMRELAATPRRR